MFFLFFNAPCFGFMVLKKQLDGDAAFLTPPSTHIVVKSFCVEIINRDVDMNILVVTGSYFEILRAVFFFFWINTLCNNDCMSKKTIFIKVC